MSDYLLLKITVLEHGSVNQNCRVGEDILTVICDPPTSPTPTQTMTLTPTNTTTPSNTPTFTSTPTLTPTQTSTSMTSTPTPTLTVTPTVTATTTTTPTPTPTTIFNSSLTIGVSYNPVSSNGVTFNAIANDRLEFFAISPLSGNAQTMMLFINAQQVAQIDFAGDYLGKNFRYFNSSSGASYTRTFVNGNVNL